MADVIIWQIAEAIKAALESTTTANGHPFTLISEYVQTGGNRHRDLLAVLRIGDGTLVATEPHGKITYRQIYEIDLFSTATDNNALDQRRANGIWASVYREIMGDPTMGGLAYDVQIESPIWYTLDGDNLLGGTCVVDVLYRVKYGDPYSK